MNILEQVREILPENTFPTNRIRDCYDENGNYCIRVGTYPNYLIIEPLTLDAERKLLANPYIHLLKSGKQLFAIFFFNDRVQGEKIDLSKLNQKYRTRYENLMTAYKQHEVDIWYSICYPPKDILKFRYIAKAYNKSKDHDFLDDENDTMCKALAEPNLPYFEIKKVSTAYNTILILDNAKETVNKALFRYKGNVNSFYTDIVINYLLEHASLLKPDIFKYEKEIYEVRIPVKELFKLYPHKTFKLQLPEGVTVDYIKSSRRQTKIPPKKGRLSKSDIAVFTFTKEFMSVFKSIINKEDSNVVNPKAFLRFPVWFLLEALKQNNLSSGGFNFLLWFLAYYRMKNPRIFHNIRTMLDEIETDVTHGYRKPIERLENYFSYLIKCKMFVDVEDPLDLAPFDLDSPLKRIVKESPINKKEVLITLSKPTK